MMRAHQLRALIVSCIAVWAIGACASTGGDSAGAGKWATADLSAALANPKRPKADRDRDADRKPAELMTFYGVEKGMTAVDLMAAGGYLTEVLSITVGPKGKVYAQNPPMIKQFAEGRLDKEMTERLAKNRLPNVVRVDVDLPASAEIPPGSVDFAITAMNLHDIYNSTPYSVTQFFSQVAAMLKPGGTLAVIDHVGVPGADNAKLHRMEKAHALFLSRALNLVLVAESDLLANPNDDHTKSPFDPALRGKTDQFVLKFTKQK